MKNILFILCSLALSSPLSFANCGLNESPDGVTLHDVMLQFGRASRMASDVGRKGSDDPASVPKVDLTRASTALKDAQDCVSAVVNGRPESLQPARARELKGKERADYLDLYYERMEAFGQALLELQVLIDQALAQPQAEEHFQLITKAERALRDRASQDHEDLAPREAQ